MGVLLTISIRNLLQARRRTLLLGTALSMVTLLLVLLLSLSQGITDNMVRAGTTLAAGHVNVAGFYKVNPETAAPVVTGRSALRRMVEENTPGLDAVIDRMRGFGKLVSETSSLVSSLAGIDPAGEGRLFRTLQLAREDEYREGGRPEVVGDPRRLAEPGTAVLFAAQARRLGVGVGDPVTVTTQTLRGATNSAELTVVGVVRDVGFLSNWTVFVNKRTLLDLYQLDDETTGAVMVYLKDIRRAEETMKHLRRVLATRGFRVMEHEAQPFFHKFESVIAEDWTGQKLDLTTWDDEISFLSWVVTGLDTISFFVVGVLLLLIVVGIMNTMWMAVRERTGEVGTLRAIGMSRARVLAAFLLEAMVLGFSAGVAGSVVGAALAVTLDRAAIPITQDAVRAILLGDTLHLMVRPGQLLAAVVLLTTVTGLAALWPAAKAARLQPVTAIQT